MQKGFGACKAVSRRGLNETKSLVPFNKTKAQEVCKCHPQPPRRPLLCCQEWIVTEKLGRPVPLILEM